MPQHDDKIKPQCTLDHASEAVAMVRGNDCTDIRGFELFAIKIFAGYPE